MSRKIFFLLILAVIWLSFVGNARAESGSVFGLGREIVIEKESRAKHVFSIAGQITIHGQVEGSVLCLFDSVVLTETAMVAGDVVSLGGVVVRGPYSVVKGKISEINFAEISDAISLVLHEEWQGWSWIFAIISIFFLMCLLVLGMIAYAVIPKQMVAISEVIKKSPWRVGCWGIGGLISIIPLAVLLTMSVVGIALVPLQMTIAVTAIILGFIAVAQGVGGQILLMFKKTDRSLMTQASLGLAVIWMLGWIPYLGWMLKAVIIVIGLGAVLVTRFGTLRE